LSLREMSSSPGAGRALLVYYGSEDPDAVRERIQGAGGAVVAYVPDHAFLVRLKPEQHFALSSPGAWVGNFQPAYKLSPRLNLGASAAATVTVLAFPDGDLKAVAAAARAAGGSVLRSSDNGINKILRVTLPGHGAA